MFVLEEIEDSIKYMFKNDDPCSNPFYDETSIIKLPVDEKGILIIDPVTRTTMIDIAAENSILYSYLEWIEDNESAASLNPRRVIVAVRTKEVTMEDKQAAAKEGNLVVDEERKKRGLTTWQSSVADHRSKRLACQPLAELREEMDRELAKSSLEPEGEVEAEERYFLPLFHLEWLERLK